MPFISDDRNERFYNNADSFAMAFDDAWKKFPQKSFSTVKYPAHEALYHALRNKYTALKKIDEQEKKAAEAKKQAELQKKT